MLVPLLLVLSATIVPAASVTLRWDPNVPSPEGYRVFARQSGQAYDYHRPHWEGADPTCTVIDLDDGTSYYFVIRAYDGDLESADSMEVQYVPAGTDNDGDGLPDAWETDVGLDPNRYDADGDRDGDGITNVDEYRSGLDPDHPGVGQPPLRPQCQFPVAPSEVETDLRLDAGAYSDPDGDAHVASQWQIFAVTTGDCLLDVISDLRLTEFNVPDMLLTGGEDYRWRVRFIDSGGKASPWSADNVFRVQAAENDLDENGIPDHQETGILAPAPSRSAASPLGGCTPTQIEVSTADTVVALERAALVDPTDLDVDATTPASLPSTMVAYKLTLRRPGQRAVVVVHLTDPAPPGYQWMKYDKVNGWQDYTHHTALSADRRSLYIEVKDGDYGDADGIANGIIIDPAGLAQPVQDATPAPAAGVGGGRACFIGTIGQAGASVGGVRLWLHQSINRIAAKMAGHPVGGDGRSAAAVSRPPCRPVRIDRRNDGSARIHGPMARRVR